MSNQANRIYSYYNARCGLGPEYFIDYLKGTACRKPLELYYKLYLDNNQITPTFSLTQIQTNNLSHAGMITLFGTNQDYTNFTEDLFIFNGIRNPGKNITTGITIPPTYYETITIQSKPYETNIIEGVCNYVDTANTPETSIDFLEYNVTTATGIFKDYTKMSLYLNNTNMYTRKIVIS